MYSKLILFMAWVLSSSIAWGQWDAQVLHVNGKPSAKFVEDYATDKYQDGWDFNEGDYENIVIKRGVNKTVIKNGKLSFITTNKTALIWGGLGLKKKPTNDEESICKKWRPYGYPWYVRIKLSQSLKYSEWYVKAYEYIHGRTKIKYKKAVLNGRGEGELLFPMSYCKNIINTLEVGTNTTGNSVDIDSIKVERLSLVRQFKKNIVLSDAVKSAKFALGTNAHFRIYVNGVLVHENAGLPPIQRKIHFFKIDSKNWNLGQNELLIESESYGSFSQVKRANDFFFMEGKIHQVNGDLVQLSSDRTWKGKYKTIGDDGENWRNVKASGPVMKNKQILQVFGKFEEALYKPYLGGIEITPENHKYPFYLESENVKLNIKLLGKNNDLEYQLSSLKGVLNQGKLIVNNSFLDTLDLGKLKADDYILRIKNISKGAIVDEVFYEIIVLKKIIQTEIEGNDFYEGLQLRLVDEFSPAYDKNERSYLEGDGQNGAVKGIRAYFPWKKSRVLERNGKASLETGATKGAWFSFKYKIVNKYKPHVLELEYPSDKKNNMIIVVAENAEGNNLANIGPKGGVPRAVSGFYQDSNKLEKFQTYKFIFWPNDREGTVNIVNSGLANKDRASVANIKIYEIENELPAVKNGKHEASVFLGPFSERIDRTIPRVFYTGKLKANFSYNLYDQYFTGYYSEWRRTFSNLIKYLRFTGSNSYFAGIYMYHAAWYSSDHFGGKAELGVNNVASGWDVGVIELMARMFEANDLNLVLGVQFFGSKNLLATDNTTQKQIYQGHDTTRLVTKNGKKARGAGGFNFLHSSVRQEMLMLAEDISNRYSIYPAIKGVMWMRSPEFSEAINDNYANTGLDLGYGDLSVGMFEKDTGITVPIDHGNVERFNNRFRWLIKNQRETWIDWRTTKTQEMLTDIGAVFNKHRPDWYLWYAATWPTPEIMQLVKNNEISFKDIFRYQGHDPEKYNSNSQLNFVPIVDVTSSRVWEDKRRNDNASQLVGLFIDRNKLPPFLDKGFFLRIGFMFERNIISLTESWPWKTLRVIGNNAPKSWSFDFSPTLSSIEETGVKVYPYGWSDWGHVLGHEQEIRNMGKGL